MTIRVPQGPQERISQAQMPVVQTSPEAPGLAFGRGAGENIQKMTQNSAEFVTDIADQELDKANKLWFLTTESAIATKQLELESKYKGMKGRDAFGAQKAAQEEFDEYVGQIATHNDSQEMGLAGIKSSRGQSLNRTISGHVNNEVERVEEQESIGYRKNLMESASSHYADSHRLAEDTWKFKAAVQDEADRQGLSGEARKAFVHEQESAFEASIIQKAYLSKDYAYAVGLYDKLKDGLTPGIQEALIPAMEKARIKVKSENSYNDITDDHLEWAARYEAAGDIEDKEVKREVINMLSRDKAEEDNIASLLFEETLDELVSNPGLSPDEVVDPVKWESFSSSQKQALIRFQKQRTMDNRGYDKLIEWYSLGAKEKSLMKFYGTPDKAGIFEKYASFMDEDSFEEIKKDWIQASKDVASGSLQKTTFTNTEIVNTFLTDPKIGFMGVDKKISDLTKGNQEMYKLFNKQFKLRIIDDEKAGKGSGKDGALTYSEKMEAANDVWGQVLEIEESRWFRDDKWHKMTFGQAMIGGRGLGKTGKWTYNPSAEDVEKAGIPFDQMTKDEVTELTNAIRELPRNIRVAPPQGFEERASNKEKTDADKAYSYMVRQYALAIKNKNEYRAMQIVREYKKSLRK